MNAESLFEDFLSRVQRGERVDLDELCASHPDHADELRARHKVWQRAGKALNLLGIVGSTPRQTPKTERPASGSLRLPAPIPEVYTDRYSLRGEIGRGGMGSILSVRDENLGRELAMKVLRGQGSLFAGAEEPATPPHELARFLEEARITGGLQHPNIVPVHELGADPKGKPYFTMKLVEGRTFREILPLARAGSEGWSVQRALSVLLKVCEAVGFAHSKGVLHRDLKPSNLMLGSFGEVYVMDWGLARDLSRPEPPRELEGDSPHGAAEGREGDSTDFRTRDGEVLGTPEYMSPEQATGKRAEVGPPSDVFAVGAMLYELLTGRTPNQHGQRGAAHVRIAAAIGSAPPEVRTLAPDTPAELCAICERAIARDPADRYSSMIELGEELRAYLEGRVVKAYATGAWAEFRKWIQRNPVVASLAGLLVTLVTLGLIVITVLALQISEQKDDLEVQREKLTQSNADLVLKTQEATDNLELAQSREIEANRAREDAQQRARELETVTEFQASMISDIDVAEMGAGIFEGLRKGLRAGLQTEDKSEAEVLERLADLDALLARLNSTDLALAVLEENILSSSVETIGKDFGDQPLVEASLSETAGITYRKLGIYPPALPLLQRSLELERRELGDDHPKTIASVNQMGTLLEAMGRLAEAEPYYREALEKSRFHLGDEDPETLGYLNNLGLLLKSMSQYEEAEDIYRAALDGRRRVLGDDDPDTLGSVGNLGLLLAAMGQFEEAEALHREVLEGNQRVLGKDDPRTLSALNNMGHLLKTLRRYEESEPYYAEALEGRRRTLGDEHPDTLTSLNNFGLLLKLKGDLEGAEPYYREALAGRRRKLGDDHPSTFVSINNMGSLLKSLDRLEEAEPFYREALEGGRRQLGPTHPRTLVYSNNLGSLLRQMERFDEALPYFQEALAGARTELGLDHLNTLGFMFNLGSLLVDMGEFEEARVQLEEALETAQRQNPEGHRLEEGIREALAKAIAGAEEDEG